MKPFTRPDNRGRVIARDDIHHKTADQGRPAAMASAKAARHAARQYGREEIAAELENGLDEGGPAPGPF
jgi:hypothetical protein